MPAKKGGKKKKRGKNISSEKKELVFAQDGQYYGNVVKKLGNGRFTVFCFGLNEERMATICGNMRKRVWVDIDSTVLVNERDYQKDRVDLVYKYTDEESKHLRLYGEIGDVKKETETEEESDIEESDSEEDIIFFEES